MKQVNAQNTIQAFDVCMDTLKLIGDVWVLAIVISLSSADLRFGEILLQIKGLNSVTLTNRLKKLEETGFIVRLVNTIDKQSVIYQLTPRGKLLLPTIDELKKLSQKLSE